MDECKVCANADNEYCFACDNGNHFKPMTNADRIRAMPDKVLAEFLAKYRCAHKAPHCREADCTQCWLDWLKSTADKEGEG